jgi:hypothetical protein
MLLIFFFSFFCSCIFAVFLTYVFKRHGPGPFNGILYFFAIIFSFTLAMAVWLHPIGPRLGGVPWLTIIGGGLLIMLIIAEVLPHKEKGKYVKTQKDLEVEKTLNEEVLEKEFSILAYVMIALLIAAIVYAGTQPNIKFDTGF